MHRFPTVITSFPTSSNSNDPRPLRRTKRLLGKFGGHLSYNPGLVPLGDDKIEGKDEHDLDNSTGRGGGTSGRVTIVHTGHRQSILKNVPQVGGHRSSIGEYRNSILDLFDAKKRDRLGMNYYGDHDNVKLWQRKLYEDQPTFRMSP